MYDKLTRCPVCDQSSFTNYLICKDHAVSGESFALIQCTNCDLVITNPRPSDTTPYYESEAYISHSNRKKNPVEWIYHIARYFTLKWKYQLVKPYLKENGILDVGCGTGQFLKKLKNKGHRINGVEPNYSARERSNRILDINLSKDLSAIEGKFDVITLWHVLEHIPDISGTLKTLKRLLTDEGKIFIAVPNYLSYDARHYGKYWAGFDVPRHLYHFSQKSIYVCAKRHGMKLEKTLPMKLDAYYVSLLSEKYLQRGTFRKIANSIITSWFSNCYGRKTGEYSSKIYLIANEGK